MSEARMTDRPLRLGEVIDDYCPRCRLLLNHDVAAFVNGEVAKVTCRTCYDTHDYKHGQVPLRKVKAKVDEKQKLVAEVLSSMPRPSAPQGPPPAPPRPKRDLWAEVERLRKR
jgi:hypothetical protein